MRCCPIEGSFRPWDLPELGRELWLERFLFLAEPLRWLIFEIRLAKLLFSLIKLIF